MVFGSLAPRSQRSGAAAQQVVAASEYKVIVRNHKLLAAAELGRYLCDIIYLFAI
jgi:hypothetical protein